MKKSSEEVKQMVSRRWRNSGCRSPQPQSCSCSSQELHSCPWKKVLRSPKGSSPIAICRTSSPRYPRHHPFHSWFPGSWETGWNPRWVPLISEGRVPKRPLGKPDWHCESCIGCWPVCNCVWWSWPTGKSRTLSWSSQTRKLPWDSSSSPASSAVSACLAGTEFHLSRFREL